VPSPLSTSWSGGRKAEEKGRRGRDSEGFGDDALSF